MARIKEYIFLVDIIVATKITNAAETILDCEPDI